MSVLKSLKGTFQNVQQDLVDGFRALTSLESTPRHEKIKRLHVEGVNLDAGADVLYRYQKDWSELQNYTAATAKKAEVKMLCCVYELVRQIEEQEVDSIVGEIFAKYERNWEIACRLEEEATALPNIVASLDNMVQLVNSLQLDFQAVEDELDKLQNVCEEEALEREKKSHLSQLAAYKKKKEAEAFIVKGKLWKCLKDRSKELETRKSHSMKERQEALMDAFTNDMDFYRTHGHPDRLPSGTEFPKVTSLSEITIEEDKEALDEFLDTGDGEQGDLSHEGGFFEDDYTEDYSLSSDQQGHLPELDGSPIDFDSSAARDADLTEDTESDSKAQTQTRDQAALDGVSEAAANTSVPPASEEKVEDGESESKESKDQGVNVSAEA